MMMRRRMIRIAIAGVLAGLGCVSRVRAEEFASLGDDKTMSALSDRGLDTLLDRMFELKHTPEAQRTGLRALRSLHQLADPRAKLTNAQRQRLVKSAVDGIAAILPTITDPDALVSYAGSLLQYGVNPDVNLLEYWGDNPVTEARLGPVVKTVIALLSRAGELSTTEAANLGNQLTGATDPRANLWQHLDDLSHTCEYKKNMVAYFLELATDRSSESGQKERVSIAQGALKYLTDLDNADSGVMPGVRLMMAKLNLARGSYSEARTAFGSIADDTSKQIVPPARCLSAVRGALLHSRGGVGEQEYRRREKGTGRSDRLAEVVPAKGQGHAGRRRRGGGNDAVSDFQRPVRAIIRSRCQTGGG